MTNQEIHQLATIVTRYTKNYHDTIECFTKINKKYAKGGSSENSEYYIFEGTDFFNNRPVFQVLGRTNDYVGEWHKNIENAETEMMELNK